MCEEVKGTTITETLEKRIFQPTVDAVKLSSLRTEGDTGQRPVKTLTQQEEGENFPM